MNLPDPLSRLSSPARLFVLFCVYVLAAVVALGANPLKEETVGPFDLLVSRGGWNHGQEKIQVRNPERSDVLDARLPSWIESRRQLRNGDFPLWNPLSAGGRPAILDPTRSQLTLGFALFAISPDPAVGFYLSVLSCLVLAGLGMHLLVAEHRSTIPALFAGISYMMCGFIAAWLFWAHTYSAIWIPWLLFAVGRLVQDGSPRYFVFAAVVTALLFLGGFPYVVALGLGAALVHAGISALVSHGSRWWAPSLRVGLAITSGLALVAIPLLTLAAGLGDTYMGYRHGGSGLTIAEHARLLSQPWAGEHPRVERNMYIGMLGLFFSAAGVLFWIGGLLRKKVDILSTVAMALLFVAVLLTFGLLPREIGQHLPVLSNNPWSRTILLLDIGLILLAACGVSGLLQKIRQREILLSIALIVGAAQFVDLVYQFRRFNGPTPARYYFDAPPAVDELKEVLLPFQYAAQDGPYFMISGTLTAVGIADWYAHTLRSPDMRRLLDDMADNPFTSPTATSINIEQYHWSRDLLDAVALCYAVYPKGKLDRAVVLDVEGKQRKAIEPINNASLRQTVHFPAEFSLRAISIRLATYRADDLDGMVNLALVGESGEVARSTLSGAQIRDNEMATFTFPDIPRIDAGTYQLVLEYLPGERNKRLTAWVLTEIESDLTRDGEEVGGSLELTVFSQSERLLDVVAQDAKVVIGRNPGCVDGPYRVSEVALPVRNHLQGTAELVAYSEDRFEIRTTGPAAGYLVVPMQHQPGWKATVNGSPVAVKEFRGVLPTVPVGPGSSTVVFAYSPPYLRVGTLLSGGALLLLLWIGVGHKRRTRG